jgi:hypothetical protein
MAMSTVRGGTPPPGRGSWIAHGTASRASHRARRVCRRNGLFTAPAVRLPRDQASSTAACTHPPPVTAKSLLLNSSWVRKWRPLITWLYSCPAVPWVAP